MALPLRVQRPLQVEFDPSSLSQLRRVFPAISLHSGRIEVEDDTPAFGAPFVGTTGLADRSTASSALVWCSLHLFDEVIPKEETSPDSLLKVKFCVANRALGIAGLGHPDPFWLGRKGLDSGHDGLVFDGGQTPKGAVRGGARGIYPRRLGPERRLRETRNTSVHGTAIHSSDALVAQTDEGITEMPPIGRKANSQDPGYNDEVVNKAVEIVHKQTRGLNLSQYVSSEPGAFSSERAAEGGFLVAMLLKTGITDSDILVKILVDKYRLKSGEACDIVRDAKRYS